MDSFDDTDHHFERADFIRRQQREQQINTWQPSSPTKTIQVDTDKPPKKPIRHQYHATISDGKVIKLQF
tara:strand:- start:269 stop:475 length:207 start_codon:yes stop_codon:yes gene_type:complete